MENRVDTSQVKGNAIKRVALIVAGFAFVFLGVLGAFLPLLPTTIFLILASACFVRSSPRANEWLRNNRLLGAYLRNYQDRSGMTVLSKAMHITALWIGIGTSALFFTENLWIRLVLAAIAVGVTIHLLVIKTSSRS